MLVTKALPHEVAFLAFVPLFAPARPSAHAPAASLSVQKTFAIPAGVAVFHYNQLPTKNRCRKRLVFLHLLQFMGLLDSPVTSILGDKNDFFLLRFHYIGSLFILCMFPFSRSKPTYFRENKEIEC